MPVLGADDDQEEQIQIDYEPLTPSVIEDEKAQSYIEALNFACSRPDIRNIAVTGPYGAGKSSVLLTWEKAENNDFRVMTVSLADFEMQQASSADTGAGDGRGDGNTAEKKAAKAEEKTIEYSILQQLLYKEKKSALPYSRLERISDVSARQIAMMAASLLLILALTATGLLFLFPDYIRAKLSFPKALSQFLLALPVVLRVAGAGLFLFSGLFLALKKLHRTGIFDRRVSIDKVDVLKGAVSTRPTAPSLLNVYIDEIVYFFEQTQYNVVIFEDLDRHNDGAIFIKLREINQLINNSLPADNPVRFIYAVRDNLFSTPESRTKFFDFVMPVIPVMDSENASEHFMGKFTSDELKQVGFSECLARLSLFIPDMRVMHNIANEFRLYRNIVNNGEDLKRLVSLIAYKNLCSEDYHSIDRKKGLLYSIVASYISGKLREEYCNELKDSLEYYQDELSRIRRESMLTEQELRQELINPYITDNTASKLYFFVNHSNEFYPENIIANEDAFLLFLNSPSVYVRLRQYNIDIATIEKKSLTLMKEQYNERITYLHKKADSGMAQSEEHIAQLSLEIQKSFSYDLVFFINKLGNAGFSKWAETCLSSDNEDGTALSYNAGQIDFLYFLLSHGYLSTDYMAYRSVFMPGSLSTEDNHFIRAVTAGRSPDETAKMPLSNFDNTVAKLRGLGMLMHDNAWHPQILWHLMYNDKDSLKIIMGMQMEAGAEQRLVRLAKDIFPRWNPTLQMRYIRLMVEGDDRLATMINQIADLNDTEAEYVLLPLLLALPALQWSSVPHESREELQRLVDVHFTLATAIPDDYAHNFCENLRISGCRLTHIPLVQSTSGKKILQSVAQENVWLYSTSNLQNLCLSLMHDSENGIEIFRRKPMGTIRSLRISALEAFVYENLSPFIRDIFIHSEEEEIIPEILNSSFIDWDDVVYLTVHMNFELKDVSAALNRKANTDEDADDATHHHPSLYSLLAQHNHVSPLWLNFMSLLDESADVDSNVLCEWLNSNYDLLPAETLPLTEELFSQLLIKAVTSPHIIKEALVVITSAFRISLINVPENLPLNNAAVLIEQKWLAPTSNVFEQLYKTLYGEGDKLTPLLYALICARPELLSENYELVLFADDEFDREITRLILNGGQFADDICISILNWLWEKDEALLSEAQLLSQQALIRFSAKLTDDRQKQVMLIQSLKDGSASPAFVRSVLQTFQHPDYAAFLTEKNHRSIVYSDVMWALAVQLGRCEFIRPPKPTHDNTRIRIEPFIKGEKGYD
ncbi:YobI family P-loop NTPase [Enterobacter chuandaensis]|uniref:YobI family P-loop NTPase n=1 Tax=Enterobacter chuandaensis TaxID=2497875 RepID=UPI001C2E6DAA|nr:pcar [Enterobacter chuandaensis]